MSTTTTETLDDLRTLARECGRDWSIGTDYMPAHADDGRRPRPIGCILIRVNAGRTERFADATAAAEFIRQPG